MKPTSLAFALLASYAAASAHAQPAAPASPITVTAPWLRATPKNAPVIGGYLTVTNTGSQPDRLTGAHIPTAAPAEVHEMTMENGVMRMRKLDNGLAIAPGATVTLTPGGEHLMFHKPTAPLAEGQSIAGTVEFEKAGAVPVTFAVGAMDAKSAPGAAKK